MCAETEVCVQLVASFIWLLWNPAYPTRVGGFDGNNRLHTAEVYDTDTNMWNPVSSMLTPRSNFGIEVINNRLFVAGGFNGFTTTFNVECYDAITDEWSAACDMGIFRSALSCCVVSRLPNLANTLCPVMSWQFLKCQKNRNLYGYVLPPETIKSQT